MISATGWIETAPSDCVSKSIRSDCTAWRSVGSLPLATSQACGPKRCSWMTIQKGGTGYSICPETPLMPLIANNNANASDSVARSEMNSDPVFPEIDSEQRCWRAEQEPGVEPAPQTPFRPRRSSFVGGPEGTRRDACHSQLSAPPF